jgi:hypothetical protein
MKNNLLYIIGSILAVLGLIILALGIFQFRWFDKYFDKNNNYKVISESLKKLSEEAEAKKTTEVKKEEKKPEIKKDFKASAKNNNVSIYAKGSSLPSQNFDSLGEYISNEEYNYRANLIDNLKIKTIVINKLTPGNGVSQEFFKVAYREKMIPAKILEDIVESKEFRNIIPQKYLKTEVKNAGLKSGETIVFPNTKVRDILFLWCLGRLTPVSKAWKVKAEK